MSSITIEDMPVCIDWQFQLRDFMNDRIPAKDILFSRWVRQFEINPLSCGNAPSFLRPPFPPLPPLAVGELQWPTGASRYGRALYAVDWPTMRAIAESAWGWQVPRADPEDPGSAEVIPSDVPAEWGSASFNSVTLAISDGEESFTAEMYPLAPYRVTGFGGTGIDLWLIPLADARYKWTGVHESTGSQPEDWNAFFNALAAEMGCPSFNAVAVDAVYDDVDPRLYKTIQPQYASHLMDVAALSVGCRVVLHPSGTLHLVNPFLSEVYRGRALGFTVNGTTGAVTGTSSAKIVSGGTRGVGALPDELFVYCQRKGAAIKKTAIVEDGNSGLPAISAWSTWESTIANEAATTAFVNSVAAKIRAWANCGGQYCSVGVIRNSEQSGYTDFLSIELLESSPGCHILRSRVHELPPIFLPSVLLVNGEEPECEQPILFRFVLSEDMSTSANAAIYKMTGELVESSFPVQNSNSDFSHLMSGDDGLCIKTNGAYYAIHPEDVPPPVDPDVDYIRFSLSEDLDGSFEGDATVSLTSNVSLASVGSTVVVRDFANKPAYSGASGWAIYANGGWRVVTIQRRPTLYRINLTCNSHDWTAGDSPRGFSVDRTSPITFSIAAAIGAYPLDHSHPNDGLPAVSNPDNLNWLNGDSAIIARESDSEYRVTKVLRQKCLRFRFKLTANAPNGLTPNLTATAICPVNSESGPPPSGSLTIRDVYDLALNAKTDQEGVAEYDYNGDFYYATQCEHNAWRFKGTLAGSFSGTPTNFNVTPVTALDGKLPSGTISVRNSFNWEAGTSGHAVACEWNPIDGRYEAYQMRCPN